MHIIPIERLRLEIGIMLTTMPKPARRHVAMDQHYETEILNRLMNRLNGCVIVKPDSVGFGSGTRPGIFGQDEPHPFPELVGKWTGY